MTAGTRNGTHHHVVIGDGLVALEFVSNLSLRRGDRLSVIGPQVVQLGRGIAYAQAPKDAAWRYAFLLNSPSDGLDPEFTDWMRDRWGDIQDTMHGRRPDWLASAKPYLARDDIGALNPPREIYGDYLRQQAQGVLDRLKRTGVQVSQVSETVVDLKVSPYGFDVLLHSGDVLSAETVDVAIGGPSNQRFQGDDGPNRYPQLSGNEQDIADRLRPGLSVCCIGSNATMLDALRLCQAVLDEPDIRFTALSTSGQLPAALYAPYPRRMMTEPDLGGPYETAKGFLAAVRGEMQKAERAGDRMAEMRAGFRKVFMEQGLATFLPDHDEARKAIGPISTWLLGGTRDAIEDFDRLTKTGQTRIITARVHQIETGRDGAVVHYEDATGAPLTHKADIVLNCAGPGRGFNFDPLTTSLINRGWVSICPVSNGQGVSA
ncbi:FAD/NAD(P)-binding protein [Phaeobacter marinintestinus]|uniref:FAD/NAD(P)-binding protein n=1 Tax=Falsiphaeobacter marinintestinus TaxID=1492905 RepID=UPI00164792A2|nr:FAD/NAD(P)-binding protein [Phaeobacter marinintestinus]